MQNEQYLLERRTQNAERRTQNAERRTQNAERRTQNAHSIGTSTLFSYSSDTKHHKEQKGFSSVPYGVLSFRGEVTEIEGTAIY